MIFKSFKWIRPIAMLLLQCFSLGIGAQVTPQQYVVQVSAVAEQQPDALHFFWPADPTAEQYQVYKRIFGQKDWGIPEACLDGMATSYYDETVEKGMLYEYGFFKKPSWIEDTIPILSGEQVTFIIHDSWGDGICCWLGFGYYRITALNSVLAEGGDFSFSESVTFTVPGLPQDSTDVILHIYFDGYPDETTWSMEHTGSGTCIANGGPYEKSRFTYITSGIEFPLIEFRGTVLMIVDDLFTQPLEKEISRLATDLVGDGWKVKRVDIGRDLPVQDVKSLILEEYTNDTTISTLFLLGHIAVPYSGEIAMDGHEDHQGAWPADVFYAELDGEWTDNLVNNTYGSRPANHNVPGDGKFDQSFIPSDVELETGRVDLSNLPAFTASETELMLRYLDKDHAYRHGELNIRKRGLIDQHLMESCDAIGWRNFPLFFTSDSLVDEQYTAFLTSASCWWSFGCSGSSYTGCGGVATTGDFASNNYFTVFTMLFGSYFGDWDNTNNVLRSPLASTGHILTNCWSCIPMWNIHPMAMGFTIGYCTKLTQNTFREYTADYGNRYVHSALMGDPTLRMYPVRPVRAVSLYQSGNNVDLSWQESEDEVAGYHVYRSGSLFSGFTRISGELITGCSYTDTSPPAGNNVYMIRALKLERTGSGTFYNLSQGIFDSIYISVTAAGNETGPPLRIFPNPAISGEIIVDAGSDFQDPVQIQVMDATGAVLFETESMDGQINHHYSISLQGFRTGVYLLIVSDKVHFKTERFVKF